MTFDTLVSIARASPCCDYPGRAPFRPASVYPEFAGRIAPVDEPNNIFDLFRLAAYQLGLDRQAFGTSRWNPFADIVNPGDSVVVKPNLVRHFHLKNGNYFAVVTHPSVVRCVLDYVALALRGEGSIIVGDAPIQSADFGTIMERTSLREVCADVTELWHVPVVVQDFRLRNVSYDGNRVAAVAQCSDADSSCVYVDLAQRSLFSDIDYSTGSFRVTNYDPARMQINHRPGAHRYVIPRPILDADVVINVPKLKTHSKVGVTAALKNLVGINGHKDCLPHFRHGPLCAGGDEYASRSVWKKLKTNLQEAMDVAVFSPYNGIRRLAVRAFARISKELDADSYVEGSWYGNDTLWRTVLDLNRLLLYADQDGAITNRRQRRCFTVVDGIIAGEGEGPMAADARACGMLAAGCNPAAVDAVLATIMGFDYRKIPIIARAYDVPDLPLVDFGPEDIQIVSEDRFFANLSVGDYCGEFCFKPPSGWVGHIESLAEGYATKVD